MTVAGCRKCCRRSSARLLFFFEGLRASERHLMGGLSWLQLREDTQNERQRLLPQNISQCMRCHCLIPSPLRTRLEFLC